MTDRTELLEAALDGLPEGIALLDDVCELVFWNQAAESITGYPALEVVCHSIQETLDPLLGCCGSQDGGQGGSRLEQEHGSLVHARHKLGHDLTVMARPILLHDAGGSRIGSVILFHPAKSLDSLPHGGSNTTFVESSRLELEDRLQALFDDFTQGGLPFGVLWINVDQAHELRRTHGATACEAMLDKVKRVLSNGLRPGEDIGRWGDDDFLVLSHECTPEMLTAHAHLLAGLARTADFRWWGDRLSLTVSIGAAQAATAESLAQLLERAEGAMMSSSHAGGNRIMPAPGDRSCLPS
jgi:diguanylate cyclase (GGDEF)-like protein/PAS domain S-box-containing protein